MHDTQHDTETMQRQTIFSYQWLRRDEVVNVRVLSSVYDLVHGGRSRVVSVRDVLVDRCVEQYGLLRYES